MRSRSRIVAALAAALAFGLTSAAAQAAVVTDSFTGTNGTLLENHVGETGATWTFHPNYPADLTLLNGRVWGPEWGLYFASGVAPTNEYDVSADLTVMSNSGAIGVVGRSLTTGSDSLYMARYNATGARWELVKCDSTGCANLAVSNETLAIGSTYALKLEIRNATKKLFVNGVQRASSTDNTITQVGRAGIRSGPGVTTSTTGYHLDNFSVTVPPSADTTITAGPSGITNNASPSFSFTSTPSGGTFECKLDGPGGTVGTWGACTSPKAYASLAQGSYTFNVRATVGGVTDPTPATRAFTVDTVAPDTTISSGPTGTITTNSASFGFTSEAGATFQCKLDGPGTTTGTYGSCSSPKAYSSLANGSYTFSVRATDTAGNLDPSPATRAFTVSVTGCTPNLGALTVTNCTLSKSDTASATDPTSLWGKIDCAFTNQHQQITTGGDTHATGDGSAQGNTSLRRITAYDNTTFGGAFNNFGERCELGRNDWTNVTPPTFNVYNAGDHRVTFVSYRLPSTYPLANTAWQVIMQMKAAAPSDANIGSPAISLHASGGRWRLEQTQDHNPSTTTQEPWSIPAQANVWTRFAFDVIYSDDPTVGRLKVYADLNGDGDALDTDEQSPLLTTFTLHTEPADNDGNNDPILQGQPTPSHLRVGMYHAPDGYGGAAGTGPIPCPAASNPPPNDPGTNGCSIDVDNVQVYVVP
jgi:hypothetical protein